jgi:integrase
LRSREAAQQFVQEILKQVAAHWPHPAQKHIAMPLAVKSLRAFARANRLTLGLPRLMGRRPVPQPLRRADWAQDAAFVFQCEAALQSALQTRPRDPQQIAGLLVASAILRGGLARPSAWVALWSRLQQGALTLTGAQALGNLVWLDLDLPKQGKRSKTTEDGETLRWFPDVVTLSLIRRWNRTPTAMQMCKTPQDVLGRVLASLNVEQIVPIDRFAAASFAALEDRTQHPLPQAVLNVASGALEAYAAPAHIWQGYLTGTRDGVHTPSQTPERKLAQTPPESRIADVGAGLTQLQIAVHAQTASAVKQTTPPVLAALSDLIQQPLAPVIRALTLWYVDLLHRRLKPSTIRRYHQATAKLLAAQIGNDDPAPLPAGVVEALCAAGLEPLGLKQAAYSVGRLASFFAFATDDSRLAWPEIDASAFGVGSAGPGRVRVALVSAADIRAGLKSLTPLHQIAFLLGARGGLRLSDMEALTVGDIERAQAHGMIGVHQTALSDLKSAFSRRKICLGDLLTGAEHRIWQDFVEARRRDARSDTEPFLAISGLLVARFDRREFAQALGAHLGLRPHDLRHGAISNLALVLMSPPGCEAQLRRLTGWRADDQARLLALFHRAGRARALDELARLAGHADATTSFASYIHLSDLALGLHLAALTTPMPREDVARLLGINKASLAKGRSDIAPEKLRGVIVQALPINKITTPPALPQPAAHQPHRTLSLDIVLRLTQALDARREPFEIARTLQVPPGLVTGLEHHRRTMPQRVLRPPRKIEDRALALDIAKHVLEIGRADVTAWATQTLRISHQGLAFVHPGPASNWIDLLPDTIGYRGVLCLKTDAELAKWSGLTAQQVSLGPKAKLVLHPFVQSGGRSATPALRFAAVIIGYMVEAQKLFERGGR